MTADSTFLQVGDERFVSLSTFRASGESVSTPVWVARDGAALVVTTPEASGKVKRLRIDPRVEIRPCSRFGRVDEGVPPVAGVASILDDADGRLRSVLRKKYGLQFLVVTGIEKLTKSGRQARVILRITPV